MSDASGTSAFLSGSDDGNEASAAAVMSPDGSAPDDIDAQIAIEAEELAGDFESVDEALRSVFNEHALVVQNEGEGRATVVDPMANRPVAEPPPKAEPPAGASEDGTFDEPAALQPFAEAEESVPLPEDSGQDESAASEASAVAASAATAPASEPTAAAAAQPAPSAPEPTSVPAPTAAPAPAAVVAQPVAAPPAGPGILVTMLSLPMTVCPAPTRRLISIAAASLVIWVPVVWYVAIAVAPTWRYASPPAHASGHDGAHGDAHGSHGETKKDSHGGHGAPKADKKSDKKAAKETKKKDKKAKDAAGGHH